MLMVIFGAGASYDSVPSRPPDRHTAMEDRPPLADELFADLPLYVAAMSQFHQCLPVIPYLQQRSTGLSVEKTLENLLAEAPQYPERCRQLMAVRYYLQMLLRDSVSRWSNQVAMGITNYKTLLDQFERWREPDDRVCLVTFNYDVMLEEALAGMGIRPSGLAAYVCEESRYWLVKPHGSVDWLRETENPASEIGGHPAPSPADIIQNAARIRLSQRYRPFSTAPLGHQGQVAAIPAIAIPVVTKSDFECPQEHLDALRAFLPQVKKFWSSDGVRPSSTF